FLAETVAAVHRPDDPHLVTLLDLARPLLTGLLEKLDQAASRNLDDYEHLHQVRILGKRLRYAMEVFADCFAPAFREKLYPMVEQMEEVIGNANDSYVAGGGWRPCQPSYRPSCRHSGSGSARAWRGCNSIIRPVCPSRDSTFRTGGSAGSGWGARQRCSSTS